MHRAYQHHLYPAVAHQSRLIDSLQRHRIPPCRRSLLIVPARSDATAVAPLER